MKLQEVTFENEYEPRDMIGIVQEMAIFLYENTIWNFEIGKNETFIKG